MSLVTSDINGGDSRRATAFEEAAGVVAAAASNTPIVELILNGCACRIAMEIENADGATAFDAALIEAMAHPNGAYFTWISSSELNTGTAIAGRLVLVSTNPTTLAAGAKSRIVFEAYGFYSVRLSVSGNAATALAKARGHISFNP